MGNHFLQAHVRTQEERNNIVKKRLKTINNKSQEEKDKTNKQRSKTWKETWLKKPQCEKDEKKRKFCKSMKENWVNRSQEELNSRLIKWQESMNNRTPEQKAKTKMKWKKTMNNKLQSEKNEINKQISETLKNKTQMEKNVTIKKFQNTLKEKWSNMSLEQQVGIQQQWKQNGLRMIMFLNDNSPFKYIGVGWHNSPRQKNITKLLFDKLGFIPIKGVNCQVHRCGKEFDFKFLGIVYEPHGLGINGSTETAEEYTSRRRQDMDNCELKDYELKTTFSFDEAKKLINWLAKKLDGCTAKDSIHSIARQQ